MQDIGVISNSYEQGSYQLFSKAYDRVRASLYFANECAKYAKVDQLKLARWTYRASLSEFKSVFDVLPDDFRRMGVEKIWKRSPFKKQLENKPLVKIMKKARDLAIHSAKLPGNHRAINVQLIDEDGERPITYSCLFFDLLEDKDIKINNISNEEIVWFNRQAKLWPVDLLIREAIYQSSQSIAGFVAVNKELIVL